MQRFVEGVIRKPSEAREKEVGLTGFEPATSASRTHGGGVLSVDSKQVTPTDANGCTNGCTNSAENVHESPPELDGAQQPSWSKLLATNSELVTIVEAWAELPDAVRVGIVAIVASCQPKGQVRGDKGEL